MARKQSRLQALDFIVMAACYSAKGKDKKALTSLTAAIACEDFDETLATLANANDESQDVELDEELDEELASDDNAGLSQIAIDEIDEIDENSEDELAELLKSEESESDEDFVISKETKEITAYEDSETSEESDDTGLTSDDLETASFSNNYEQILAELEVDSEESEEEVTANVKTLSRAQRNQLKLLGK